MTMEATQMDSALYYQYPFRGFMSRKELVEFIVIGIDSPEFDPNETKSVKRENFKCVQVELKRVSDIGKNEDSYLVHTHLGETLNHNDSVMCYDLVNANFTEGIAEGFGKCKKDYPDVVVVKKHFPRMRRKHRKRWWKVDRIPINNEEIMEEDGEDEEVKKENRNKKKTKTKKAKRQSKHKAERDEQKEFEEFLQDLEEDPELRSQINLYKNKKIMEELENKLARVALNDKIKEIKDGNKVIQKKKVLTAKRKTDKGEQLQKEKAENDKKTKEFMAAIVDDDESEVEEDFPAVNLEELMENLKIDD